MGREIDTQILSTLLVLAGVVVGMLGLIGVAIGKVPLLKLKGRGFGIGAVVSGLALLILGVTLAPIDFGIGWHP